MKTKLPIKSMLKTAGIIFCLLIVLTINNQPVLAKSGPTWKTVFYKGEWITRVELPEVKIEAYRIIKDTEKPCLKNIETVYENGHKMLHVTMNDIVISGADQNAMSTASNTFIENKPEKSMLESDFIITDRKQNFNKGVASIELAKNKLDNSKTTSASPLKLMDASNKKRPAFSRIINTMVDAGFRFLQKINDGLFFKI